MALLRKQHTNDVSKTLRNIHFLCSSSGHTCGATVVSG